MGVWNLKIPLGVKIRVEAHDGIQARTVLPFPLDANGDLECVEKNGEPVPVEGNEDPHRNEWRPRRYKWSA